MPNTTHDADDTQPLRNAPGVNHRQYIAAEWAAPGAGGGHPKLSGGFTVDKLTGLPAPRAFNRPDQRYEQPQSTILANRSARAVSEYASSVILRGADGRIEIRSSSGNNYDVGATLLDCDCPDWLRLDESGYGILRCKHIYLAMLRLSDPLFPLGPDWSTARLAEFLGVTERTAQSLCQDGFFSAAKQHNVWVIPPLEGEGKGLEYIAKLMFNPRDWSDTLVFTPGEAEWDEDTGVWFQPFQIENTALFTLQGQIRLMVFDESEGNTPILQDGFTETFAPVGSPYYIVDQEDMEPGDIVEGEIRFFNETGSALSFSHKVIAGKGLI